MAGMPICFLRANIGIKLGYADLLKATAFFLDEVRALRDLETELPDLLATVSDTKVTDFHRALIHVEINAMWLLGVLVSRMHQTRRRIVIMQRSLRAHAEAGGTDARMSVDADLCKLLVVANSESLATAAAFPYFELPAIEKLDPEALYQQTIALALSHSGGQFDLGNIDELAALVPNLPRDTIVSAVLPVFLSRSFDEIAAGLTKEMRDPRYAFLRSQMIANGYVTDAGVSDLNGNQYDAPTDTAYASPNVNADDVAQLLSWSVCFDHDRESSASFFFSSFLDVAMALHLIPPSIPAADATAERSDAESSSTSVESDRLQALNASLSKRRGQAWATFPRTKLSSSASASASSCVSSSPSALSSLSSSGDDSYRAPDRASRSMQGVRLMYLAVKLAQKIEDSCATAFCVLHLALLLIYWVPHYGMALQLLEKLEAECDALLCHMPADVGPAWERAFIVSCRAQGNLISSQLRRHQRAGLRSPFFIGSSVTLNFGAEAFAAYH